MVEKEELNVRVIAITAILASLSVAGRLALAGLPGVQPTTVIVIVTTMALGLKYGILVVILSTIITNFYLGHGIWTFFQLIAWLIVAFISYLYGKSSVSKSLILSALFAGLTGILYGMIVSLNGLLYTNKIILYYVSGLPHDLSHAAANFVIYFILGGRLHQLLQSMATKYFKH